MRFLSSRLLFALALAPMLVSQSWGQQTVFDNTNTLPTTPSGTASSGPSSFPFFADQTRQLGDYIILDGTNRTLLDVRVPMAIYTGTGGVALSPFNLSITLSLYNVDLSGSTAAVGSTIATIVQTFTVPGVSAGAFNRAYFSIDFDATALNIILPNRLIWSISYDATVGSAQTLNEVCWDPSVLAPGGSPSPGAYGDPNAIFIDSDVVTTPFGRATFATDLGQTFRPAATFTAIPEPSIAIILGAIIAAGVVFRRRG